MTTCKSEIRISIDAANPGQFFACCGLLELADRLWPGAEGWFEGRTFCLAVIVLDGESFSRELMRAVIACELTNMTAKEISRLDELSKMKAKERERVPGLEEEKKELEKRRRERPVVLHEPFNLRIDWFLDKSSGGDRFKTWAGQQGVLAIASAMKKAVCSGPWDELSPDRWLGQIANDNVGLPFNFDSNLSGQASSIDLGFSMDPLNMSSPIRPFIELLAFIGLQRFRPAVHARANRFTYVLWTTPFPAAIAAIACCGVVDQPTAQSFDFVLLYRTDYLKSFTSSQPARGDLCPK